MGSCVRMNNESFVSYTDELVLVVAGMFAICGSYVKAPVVLLLYDLSVFNSIVVR